MTGKHMYKFFADAIPLETEKPTLTGAEIKAMIPDANKAYQLYLEEPGDEPDKPIDDSVGVSLDPEGHGIRKFYLVPPATFGDR